MFWLNLAISFFSQLQTVTTYDDCPLVRADAPCPAACAAPLYAPMPVGLPSPLPAAKTYRVDLRFTGPPNEVPPSKLSPYVTASPANTATMCLQWHAGGAAKCGTVTVAAHEADGGRVELMLDLVSSGPKGWSCKARQAVHVNTPTSVVLRGDCPEPCTAEVTVTEAPAPMPMMLPPPLAVAPCQACPGPVSSIAYVTPMKAPAYASPIPVCCPLPEPMAYPAQVQLCSVPAPAEPIRSTRLTVVRDGEKSRVHAASGKSSVTATRMEMECGDAGKFTVSAGKGRVRLAGKAWAAQAESVEVRDDGSVTLRGQVKLSTDKLGTEATITAKELSVKLKRGSFDRIEGRGVQAIEGSALPRR